MDHYYYYQEMQPIKISLLIRNGISWIRQQAQSHNSSQSQFQIIHFIFQSKHNSWKKAQVVVQYAFGSLGDLDLPCIALFYKARLSQFHYWLIMSDQSYSMKAFYYPKITQLTHHSRSWIQKEAERINKIAMDVQVYHD